MPPPRHVAASARNRNIAAFETVSSDCRRPREAVERLGHRREGRRRVEASPGEDLARTVRGRRRSTSVPLRRKVDRCVHVGDVEIALVLVRERRRVGRLVLDRLLPGGRSRAARSRGGRGSPHPSSRLSSARAPRRRGRRRCRSTRTRSPAARTARRSYGPRDLLEPGPAVTGVLHDLGCEPVGQLVAVGVRREVVDPARVGEQMASVIASVS